MVETESTLHVLQSSKVEWIEESRLDKTWTRRWEDNGREDKERRGERSERKGEKVRKAEVENKGGRDREREGEAERWSRV